MDNTKNTYPTDNRDPGSGKDPVSRKLKRRHAFKTAGILAGVLAAAVTAFLAAATAWLTPGRLSAMISREAARYVDAEIKVVNPEFTFWTTFPHLHLSADSISVEPHVPSVMNHPPYKALPESFSRLLAVGHVRGCVDVWKALCGEIALSDVEMTAPEINIVVIDDSLANYDIMRRKISMDHMPHVAFTEVRVVSPVMIRFADEAGGVSAAMTVDNAELKCTEGRKDTYEIRLAGNAMGMARGIRTREAIPVSLAACVALGFSPATVTLTDCRLAIAGVNTVSGISVILGKNPVIGKLNMDMACGNVKDVIDSFDIPGMGWADGISAELPLDATLRLDSPYELGGNGRGVAGLPPVTLSAEIPGGSVDCPMGQGDTLGIRDLALQADLVIDPASPERCRLSVPVGRLSARGARLDFTAKAGNLMSGNPELECNIRCHADLEETLKGILHTGGMELTGNLDGATTLACRLSGQGDRILENVSMKGQYEVSPLKFRDGAGGMSADISGLTLKVNAFSPGLSASSLAGTRVRFRASASAASVKGRKDSMEIECRDLTIGGETMAVNNGRSHTPGGELKIGVSSFSASFPGLRLDTRGVDMNLSASLRQPGSGAATMAHPSSSADSIISARTAHTPLYLTADVPPAFRSALGMADVCAGVMVKEGTMTADAYPVRNSFSNVDITTNLDTLSVNSLHVATRGSSADLRGNVSGLRDFLMSASPVPLKCELDAIFGDVDINKLSGNYYAGQRLLTGITPDFNVEPPGPYTAADSLCVIIPRNLQADIRMYSDRAEYMEWMFSPLSTRITVDGGVARIGDLRIGSGFGNVALDWIYSTVDLGDIFMKLKLGVDSLDLADFFKTFPVITESAPELDNLSGLVSVNADGIVRMFPNMFVNAPSMTASVGLDASDLEFRREGKVKRITNMMLLKGDVPLRVSKLGIRGSFHDNLLQVDPFMIDCGPYKVGVAGVNNLGGEIYYHVGVHGSPLHIPFGVNLVGNWRHPGIRFGGAGINDGRERKIASDLDDDVNVNIMRELKHGWLLFVENAAKFDAGNNQDYVFNVK